MRGARSCSGVAILCAALVVVSVFEWSVCEVCLSKHSPVMFTQQQGTFSFNAYFKGLTNTRRANVA